MRPVYIAGDNIINSLGLTTPEVMRKVESGITGIQKYEDRSLTPTPVPLSLVNTDLLTAKFREIMGVRHPEMREEHFTRLEKMFIVSIHDAVKEIETDLYESNSLLVISSTKGNIDLLEEGKKDFHDPGRIYLW